MNVKYIALKVRMLALILLGLVFLIPSPIFAERLPCMDEIPWRGFFSGYKRHGFEFGINDEGRYEIYLIGKNRKRVGNSKIIKIYAEVIVVYPDGKRLVKRLKSKEGFHTDQEPGLDHETVKFTAESTGDAKVELSVKYERNKIILDGNIIDRGSLKKGKLILNYKVMIPAMYTSTYTGSGKKSKARMRKDKVSFVRAVDSKRISLKSYEEVDLRDEKMAKQGVTELKVSMDGQEGKDLLFTTTDEKGLLRLGNKTPKKKGKLWAGYYVRWERTMGDDSVAPFVIEVR